MSEYTSILFARPSFLEGMARVMDLGGTLNDYNYSIDEDQADELAHLADWEVVKHDLLTAIHNVAGRLTHGTQET